VALGIVEGGGEHNKKDSVWNCKQAE
jgi:hypothetical protein